MNKNSKLSKNQIADGVKTVCAVVTVVYIYNIVCHEIVKRKDERSIPIQLFNKGKITPTQIARHLSKVGRNDKEVNRVVSLTDTIHVPSGIHYSSDRVRWKTDQSSLPLWPCSLKTDSGRWEILTESLTWEALPSSASRRSKGECNLAIEFANSFSEEAKKNPKLERDLEEGEVDSYSETHAYKFFDESLSSPLGRREGTERYEYELVGSPYIWTQPAGFRNSIFGRGVIILCVVAVIRVLVNRFVFKPKAKETVEKKQNGIPQKEGEEK